MLERRCGARARAGIELALVMDLMRVDTVQIAITGIACAAFLAIAALAVMRARREPSVSRFAALCVALFAYNAFDLLADVSGDAVWVWLWTAAASMCAPIFFHFSMAFIGQRRVRRPSIVAFYVWFAALALGCLSPAVTSATRWFPNGALWAALMLAGVVGTVVLGAARMVRYARRQAPQERARVTIVLGAVLVIAGGNATDLASIAEGSHGIRLGVWATLAGAMLLGAVAARTRMLEKVSVLVALNAVVVAIAVVLGEIALFHFGGERSALLAVGSVLIALTALLAGRFLLVAMLEARARVREQAARGRMSQQLAHDLGTPLTAIKGAAQWFEVELEAGRLPPGSETFLPIILENVARAQSLGARYQRLARFDPQIELRDLNEVVQKGVDLIAQSGATATIRAHLDASLPHAPIDDELVLVAVENVLRNAAEALGEGGVIRVTTRSDGDFLAIEIADDGPGMDARTRENVFDDYFTTKARGSGLGLAFVQRVVAAHSGRVSIDSTLGKGTTVTLELPAHAPDAHT